MSIEHFEENNPLEVRNQMQFELAKRHHEDFLDFINKHAKDFGDYFDGHPELAEKYRNDKNEALGEVKRAVYH